jgi:hypothetical protein
MRDAKGNRVSPMIEHNCGMIAETRLHLSVISAVTSADRRIDGADVRFCGTDAC